MAINDEIKKIRDIIIKTIPLERLYFFGSYVYGTPNEDSDYDFYAVIPNGGMRPLEAIQKIYGVMWGATKKPIDILAGTDILRKESAEEYLELCENDTKMFMAKRQKYLLYG